MTDFLGLGGIGLAVFAVTDLDDLFLLVAFFAAGRLKSWQIAVGQYLGIALLIGASALSYLLRLVVPQVWIGLAGLVPLGLGVREAIRVARDPRGGDVVEAAGLRRPGVGVLGVTAVTVANGGDNLAVYVPLFASSEPLQIAVLALIFLVMTGGWLGIAWILVHNPLTGRTIRRWGAYLLPAVLVALGVYVLAKQGTIPALVQALSSQARRFR